MKYPNLKEEKKLWEKGYKFVVGLDEAGRGALAGPVVAAAVILNSKFEIRNSKFKIQRLRDSKKLTAKKREEIYKIIKNSKWIEWGIGKVSEKVIDKINIFEATKLAMKRALKNLNCKLQIAGFKRKNTNKIYDREKSSQKWKIGFLILDGNFKLDLPIPQEPIVKADEKIFSCALASILAKVYRDKLILNYHKKYPKYRFDLHKGYLTRMHLKLLRKYGPCKIHRKSFSPVKELVK